MKINQIGEFALINKIKHWIKVDTSVFRHIGEDCAVINYSKNKYLLFTCDMLMEGVDFYRQDSPFLIGRKAIAVSLSDIAAKGGLPKYCLLSLGLPPNTSLKYIQELYRGFNYWTKKFKLNIVGGDLSRAEKITIDVSILGFVEKKKLVLRDGAKIGDFIFVSGPLGEGRDKHFIFTPEIKKARYLVNNYKINAMIDVSDGFLQDLSHILKESHKGAVIFERLLPLADKKQKLSKALSIGEDFQLLFTVSRVQAKRLLAKKNDFYPVGLITAGKGIFFVDRFARMRKLNPSGYRHF